MLSPAMQEAYMPLAFRLMQGESVDFPKVSPEPIRAMLPATGKQVLMMDDWEDDDDYEMSDPMPETQVVMIYPVKGMITKEDQYCGPRGTESLMRLLKKYDAMPEVMGHILEFDSGGGEATNIETVARTIRSLQKPTIAWYNGYCASAAYYMACACDEVYASEETDEVGSIGVLVSFADLKPYYENMGVKFHQVYADQSELKNKPINDAYEGNYDALKTEMLNPYAARFIATVQEFRPNLKDEDAYKGRLYMTPAAISIGMIDGMASLDEVIGRIQVLHIEKQRDMGLNTLFGGKPAPNAQEMTPAHDVAADIQALEASLNEAKSELASLRTELNEMRAGITAATQAIESIQEARRTSPGAAPAAVAAADTEPPLFATGEEDALAAMEAAFAKTAAADDRTRFS